MKYKVFYDDWPPHEGDTHCINHTMPSTGVQVVVMPNPDGGIMTAAKSDYYVLDQRAGDTELRWYGVDLFGLFDYLMSTGLVLFGKTINGQEFRRILEDAMRTNFE